MPRPNGFFRIESNSTGYDLRFHPLPAGPHYNHTTIGECYAGFEGAKGAARRWLAALAQPNTHVPRLKWERKGTPDDLYWDAKVEGAIVPETPSSSATPNDGERL